MLDALARRGWSDLTHDVSCAGVQVDLIGRAPSGVLTLVEVKMQSAAGLARVSRTQGLRLARAALALSQCEPVQIALAFVEGANLTLVPVDALTSF